MIASEAFEVLVLFINTESSYRHLVEDLERCKLDTIKTSAD